MSWCKSTGFFKDLDLDPAEVGGVVSWSPPPLTFATRTWGDSGWGCSAADPESEGFCRFFKSKSWVKVKDNIFQNLLLSIKIYRFIRFNDLNKKVGNLSGFWKDFPSLTAWGQWNYGGWTYSLHHGGWILIAWWWGTQKHAAAWLLFHIALFLYQPFSLHTIASPFTMTSPIIITIDRICISILVRPLPMA